MDELLIILSWNKMSLYSILDNLQGNSNIVIYNLKWLNSNIESKLITNDYIKVVDVEFKEDLIETLNHTLVNSDINVSKIVFIKPEKIPVYNLIVEYLKKIEKRQIYQHESFYICWYDKNINKNVKFKESNILNIFDSYINYMIDILDYEVFPNIQKKSEIKITKEKETLKYKTIIYSRCKKLLFDQIEDYNISNKLFSINFGKNNFNIKLRQTLESFTDDEYFILVNHYSYSLDPCLEYLKNNKIKTNITISEEETHNKIYVINKKFLNDLNINNYFTDIEILKTIEDNTKKIKIKKNITKSNIDFKKSETNTNFIFILPFMDNGDRKDLFEATLKNLKYQLNKNDSINGEILVFECR